MLGIFSSAYCMYTCTDTGAEGEEGRMILVSPLPPPGGVDVVTGPSQSNKANGIYQRCGYAYIYI